MKVPSLALIIFSGLQLFLNAQEVSVSTKIDEIYFMLPQDCRKLIHITEENTCDCDIWGKQVRVRALFNDSGLLSHIGMDLFPSDQELALCPEVLCFLERTFLEYLLVNDISINKKKAEEDKIELWLNGNSLGDPGFTSFNRILPVLLDGFKFNIVHDSLYYFAEFYQSSGSLKIKFAANYNTITGMDKAELENKLYDEIINFKDSIRKECTSLIGNIQIYKDIYCYKGNIFLPGINADIYYDLDSNIYSPVYDKNHLNESFSNYFLCSPSASRNIKANIEYKMYGNFTKSIECDVTNFLNLFSQEYEFYFGLEDSTSTHLRGVLIIYNRNLNYFHLLDILTDEQTLFEKGSNLYIKLYSYIPIDNIKDLFGKYISKS